MKDGVPGDRRERGTRRRGEKDKRSKRGTCSALSSALSSDN